MSRFFEEINWPVSGKFIILDLIWIDTYPRYGFTFSACRFLANLSLFSLSHSWATEIWEAPEHLGAPRMFGSEGQNPTQHSIWLENPHSSDANVRGDSELWDPLEASHSTPSRSCQPHRALERPAEGTAKVPAQRQNPVKIGLILQGATYEVNQRFIWHWVHRRKNTWVWEPRHMNSGPTNRHSQKLTDSLCASCFYDVGPTWLQR